MHLYPIHHLKFYTTSFKREDILSRQQISQLRQRVHAIAHHCAHAPRRGWSSARACMHCMHACTVHISGKIPENPPPIRSLGPVVYEIHHWNKGDCWIYFYVGVLPTMEPDPSTSSVSWTCMTMLWTWTVVPVAMYVTNSSIKSGRADRSKINLKWYVVRAWSWLMSSLASQTFNLSRRGEWESGNTAYRKF